MKILKYISKAIQFFKSLNSKETSSPNKASNSLLSLMNSEENETLFI
ncbi:MULTISPECIES: hypothetical protein [unclassified Flavobacterium]|jgi:hypothetical protein|nr:MULTISPECIES: hypothetical protein [unclassified Flavobacterium]